MKTGKRPATGPPGFAPGGDYDRRQPQCSGSAGVGWSGSCHEFIDQLGGAFVKAVGFPVLATSCRKQAPATAGSLTIAAGGTVTQTRVLAAFLGADRHELSRKSLVPRVPTTVPLAYNREGGGHCEHPSGLVINRRRASALRALDFYFCHSISHELPPCLPQPSGRQAREGVLQLPV